ncbi:MAG: type I restriction-modification system subunit M [Planctomycetota bacterium]|nr:MAG: type I restriction-modification system subunit M [Planctomycetota bacterium]REK28040.1 MAG: type I restriction-modification system subunit M [Planctomycetota bacterium]REK37567.1 MAG: type I restriction-modification system subunit M [Planctomycetota bacterium]
MSPKVSREEILNIVWKACDTFRGAVDPAEYKNYILTMLFIKYMSDMWKDKRAGYEEKYKGDKTRVERALGRERFVVPPECDFDYLYSHRDAANVGELINIALEKIEDANKTKLENVFRNIDFNSEPALGQTRERNRRLKNLLDDFNNPKLDLRPSRLGDRDIIGDVYEYLIGKFAAGAGKKAGEFYTPPEVSTLLAKLVNPKTGDRICDPACGSGSLLIKVGNQVGSDNFSLFGQESNGSTWALCRMNMFLHEMDAARIEWCDTIGNPRLVEGDKLMKFNVVVANPPFSLDKWGQEEATADKFNRFWRGVPPKSRGDYAFVTHMIETAVEDDGKVGVIVPHGVLFRGGSEGAIRQKLIEESLLEAVIGLPPNLFFGTGIPAAILIFHKGRKAKDVLFIDASREFEDGKNQNYLRGDDIEKITKSFQAFKTVEKYAYRATFDEIEENDFNLNIPRYVDTYEEEEPVDIDAVQDEITRLEAELAETRAKMAEYMKELGYAK